MAISITIDNRPVEVAEGQSILDGARKLGIDIPTLCYLERCGPMTSCLVCIVKLKHNGRTSVVPSCGMTAVAGMVVESETAEVRTMRKTALELLLSDHVGDCFAPCQRICPLKLDIPEMLRIVRDGKLADATALVRDAFPLASITGRLCNRPCEQGCRRGTWDESMAIRDVERNVADAAFATNYISPCKANTGKRVAIVGSGPAGLSTAWYLRREGHACTVITRGPESGGSLRTKASDLCAPASDASLSIVDSELRLLSSLGIEFKTSMLIDGPALAQLASGHDVVVLATGDAAKAQAPALGIAAGPNGLKIDPNTSRTSMANVFAVGAAVKPVAQVTRAIGEGLAVGRCVDQFLRKEEIAKPAKAFSSIMGKVDREEVEVFVKSACSGNGTSHACGGCGYVRESETASGAARIDASTESERCLHCDCRAVGNCSLQYYSEMLGADPGRFRPQRRRFEQFEHPGNVLYEPGKCILCGICVHIAKEAAEPLGLTFIGRGFDVRVGAPMNQDFELGLQKVARECAEACPTGAIVLRNATSNGSGNSEGK
jgi:ferredoxin